MSSTSDVSVNQTRNVLLHLLDGYNGIVLFTTNFVSNYDSAFYRRILAHIKFDLPNKAMREKIWLHFLVDAFPIDEDKNVMAEKLSSIDGVLHILQQGQRNIFLADHDGAGSDLRNFLR